MAKKEEKSDLARYLVGAGASGLVQGAFAPSHKLGSGLAAAGLTAAGMGAGDLLFGKPESYLGSLGKGAAGGALVGGLAGLGGAVAHPQGMALVHYLMKAKGLSKGKAIAAILGGGSALGGLMGSMVAGSGGNSGYHFTTPQDEWKFL